MATFECAICGGTSSFSSTEGNERDAACPKCGALRRESDLCRALAHDYSEDATFASLADLLPRLNGLRILYTSADGPLHTALSRQVGYVRVDVIKAVSRLSSVRFDLPDDSLDLIIAPDVLPFAADPWRLLAEFRRLLKPSGKLYFTTPWHPQHETRTRAVRKPTGVEHLLPPLHVGTKPAERLIYTDFGSDLVYRLKETGFITTVHEFGTDNSPVFVAENFKLSFVGERFVPEMKGTIAYEHLHRYAFALPFVTGKTALDIACGEGYGTVQLAQKAAKVIGVDVAGETVEYAKARYAHCTNVEFRTGSCEAIPCENASVDVVISFETIEHIDDQDKFMEEVRRVLSNEGVFVLSSPNKETYSDVPKFNNPYHRKELYGDELLALLQRHFRFVQLYGQRLTFSSHMWPVGEQRPWTNADPPFYEPVYFIAVCSQLPIRELPGQSLYTDPDDFLLHDYYRRGQQVHQLREKVEKLSRKNKVSTTPSIEPPIEELKNTPNPILQLRNEQSPIVETTDGQLVSIVIPVLNNWQLTEACLESLSHHTPLDDVPFEVIVVDNASTDETPARLREAQAKYDWLRVITNRGNLGFARACNQGAAAAEGHPLFLNNDTEVRPNWLRPLVEILQRDPRVAAVGPKITYFDGRLQHTGMLLINDQKTDNPLTICHFDAKTDLPLVYPVLVGACMLVRRSAFLEVGGFDERFWNGYEDVDLCLQFTEHGYLMVFVPTCSVAHHLHKGGPERYSRQKQNIKRLHEKWLGKVVCDALRTKEGKTIVPRDRWPKIYRVPQASS